jgi:hypothetical protein
MAPGLRARGSRYWQATSVGVNTTIVSQLCGNRELASACRHSHPTGLRTRLVRHSGSPDYPAPVQSTRWRSGWPCWRAEANSRLPQRPCAAAAFTPATVTRLHLEPRARKPAGMDAHCARQERRHLGWPAGRPWRLACVLALIGLACCDPCINAATTNALCGNRE